MPAPTNISALTAIDLGSSYPATATQQVDDAGTTYDVWYSTTPAEDGVLGMFGFGDLVVYRPDTSIFTGPAAAPTPYFIQDGGNNACCYFPVTGGTTYYFKFTTNSGNPSPANLSISLIRHTNVPAPVGSIAVNDDQTGFPLALLSSADGDVEVLTYVPPVFANGETAADLDDGTVVVYDSVTVSDIIYSPQFAVLGSVAIDPFTSGSILCSNRVDAFYGSDRIGGGASLFIKRFLADGTVTDIYGPITLSGGLDAIAVSPDETVLYYFGNAAANTPIKRWDLTNNLAMADLTTVGSSRVDLQACKLEYSIVSPK